MGYNGRLSLKKGKSVNVRNLPYPVLHGQPLKGVKIYRPYNYSKIKILL